jgi:hypothetical protein
LAEFPPGLDKRINYHLRFETTLPGSMTSAIWVDLLNEEAVVPMISPGMVSIKALKLPPKVAPRIKKPKVVPVTLPMHKEQSLPIKKSPRGEAPSIKKPPSTPDEEFNFEEEKKEEVVVPKQQVDIQTQKAIFSFDFGEEKKEEPAPSPKKKPPPVLEPLAVRQEKAVS